jgi:hypothetical protein
MEAVNKYRYAELVGRAVEGRLRLIRLTTPPSSGS